MMYIFCSDYYSAGNALETETFLFELIISPTKTSVKYDSLSDFTYTLMDLSRYARQEQNFIPLYTRDKLTDALHNICGFETDYKFITKRQMKNIQKKSKGWE